MYIEVVDNFEDIFDSFLNQDILSEIIYNTSFRLLSFCKILWKVKLY